MKKVCCLLGLAIAFIIMGCDSGNLMLDIVEEGSDNSFLAPRNPETYLVYIQPDDPDYHIARLLCLKPGRTVVSETEALAQGYTPCEICFPPPPELVELNVWAIPETGCYHRAYCPDLTGDKLLMSLVEAQGTGYETCPTCYWQTKRIIRKGVRIDRENSEAAPVGDDPDGEVIVLKNLDSFTVNVGGWTLSDGEPRGVYEIPDGDTIPPYGTWQVARSQYNPNEDTQALYLNNQHDSVSLRDAKGGLVDVWSW